MEVVTLKQEETYPYIEAVLKQNGTPINLTEVKKVYFIAQESEGVATIKGTCTFPEPTTGKVVYEQKTSDVAVAGEYNCEWLIEWNNGKVTRVPNEGYAAMVIKPVLAKGEEAEEAAPEPAWRRDYHAILGGTVVKGTWAITEKGTEPGWQYTNTSAAEKDAAEWIVDPPPGTWNLAIGYTTATNGGKGKVFFDGTEVYEIDCYKASSLAWEQATLTGLVIPSGTKHALKFEAIGKDGGSTGYALPLQAFSFVRSA